MSASDEIKEQIVHYCITYGLVTQEKDWKRLSKKKIGNDIVREFENKIAGIVVSVVGDDEAEAIIDNDEWIYGVGTMDPQQVDDHGETDMYVSFASRRYWNGAGHIPDQHIGFALQLLKNLPADIAANEDMENWFSVPGNYNRLTIHMALKKAGFVYDKAFEDFIQPGAGPAVHTVGTRPTFTHVKSSPASSTSSSSTGGYYDTGLEPGKTKPSDFVFAVGVEAGDDEDDSEVRVFITCYQDFINDGGFDQSIAPLVDNHLPGDWYESSEQDFTPGNMTAKEAYEYLVNAGFQIDSNYANLFAEHYEIYDPQAPEVSASVTATTAAEIAEDETDEIESDQPVQIKSDPEPWSEFCKEIWDAWQAKTTESLKITWVDSYRYREATIVGLAYEFKMLEYTGIRIQAGYQLEDGTITNKFEIPDSVFEEMFSEFGGSWNDGDAEHFINKRKGEDEHGFTFSSNGLWDEVKPILDAKGWKEVQL